METVVPKGKVDNAEKLKSTRQTLGKQHLMPTVRQRAWQTEPKREAVCLSTALTDVLSCINRSATSHRCALQPSENMS